jgi:hypothetical protein
MDRIPTQAFANTLRSGDLCDQVSISLGERPFRLRYRTVTYSTAALGF